MPARGARFAAAQAGAKAGKLHKHVPKAQKLVDRSQLSSRSGSNVEELMKNVGGGICVMHSLKDIGRDDDVIWTKSTRFNTSVGVVILVNALTLGLEADHGRQYADVFMILENCFCSIFSAELLCHLYFEGIRDFYDDRMNWLDTFLVLSAVLDVWVIQPIGVEANLKVISVLRMLRLTRLIRLLRLFRIFKELSIMVEGFVASVPTVSWTIVFLSVLLYIGAIFARTTIGSSFTCSDNDGKCQQNSPSAEPSYAFNPDIGDQVSLFGSVDKTMVTLFCCLIEGCGVTIIQPVSIQTPVLFLYFFLFTGFTTFGVLNLIVAIFCESSVEHADNNQRWLQASIGEKNRILFDRLRGAYEEMDVDGDGKLTKDELLRGVTENETVMDAFCELGLEEEEGLFETLDADHSGNLSFNQFLDGVVLILKGQNAALAKDFVAPNLLLQAFARRCTSLEQEIRDMIQAEKVQKQKVRMIGRMNQGTTLNLEKMSNQIQVIRQDVSVLKSAVIEANKSRPPVHHPSQINVDSAPRRTDKESSSYSNSTVESQLLSDTAAKDLSPNFGGCCSGQLEDSGREGPASTMLRECSPTALAAFPLPFNATSQNEELPTTLHPSEEILSSLYKESL